MRNLIFKCTPGYPMSGGTGTFMAKVAHPPVAVERKRFVNAEPAVRVQQQALISDLPTVLSAHRAERRT